MFYFGSDPEFMVVDDYNQLRSAINILKAPKKAPIKIGRCTFYYDNVLAECTMPPGKTKKDVVENIGYVLGRYSELLAPYRLITRASGCYPTSELLHKHAKLSGCKPEACAYKIDNIRPSAVRSKIKKGTLRTAGGHIHLGTDLGKKHISCLMLVRMLDLFLAIPSMYMDHDETTMKRKTLYGVAGRYRQPPHGVEYRSLGNFWLSSPKLVEIVYDLCSFAIKFVEDGRHNEFWSVDEKTLASDDFWNNRGDPAKCHVCKGYDVETLRNAYDTTNKELGGEFLKLAFRHLPKDLCERITEASRPKKYDVYKEWNIE
jgi:hypothetical protein